MSFIPLSNFPYTRTYRFGEEHIRKLVHLSEASRKDQSEIVREALDEYFERHAPALPTPPTQEPQS